MQTIIFIKNKYSKITEILLISKTYFDKSKLQFSHFN